ncbi:sporulation protein YlmC with PRC-barrel domain [Rhodoligotrophos appendicifer]|uniref:PRC-barrel domain-containing protein n=2 Tax=Rhodoligotrophos appendicifer TaxID=987056 RepID=UPI003D23EB81
MKIFPVLLLTSTMLLPVGAMAQTANDTSQAQRTEQNANANNNTASWERQARVSDLRGQMVYDPDGETIGRIDGVIVNNRNQPQAVIVFRNSLGLGEEPRLVALNQLGLQNDYVYMFRTEPNQIRNLAAYDENQQGMSDASDEQQVSLGQYRERSAENRQAEDGSIIVQQRAPSIRLSQIAPRITVRQPQPDVTVSQAQPEILVRQPSPTVTVDIPQPQITVRMPEPDVNVAMARPQVEVNQPDPEVQLLRSENRPQVEMSDSQPEVDISRAEGEPRVQTQRQGQPQVRFEREEPRVVVNRAQGQPTVRFEKITDEDQTRDSDRAQAGEEGQDLANQRRSSTVAEDNSNSPYRLTDDDRRRARERLGPVNTQAMNDTADAQRDSLSVSEITQMDVYNMRGERLGEVDRIIRDADGGRNMLVLAHGGFLGIGEDKVAFPLSRFSMQGDRLVISNVTDEDIEGMENYRNQIDQFRRLNANATAELRVID